MFMRGSLPEAPARVQYLNPTPDRRGQPRAADPNMQLPDEAIAYQYQALLLPAAEDWTPSAELRTRHFLAPGTLKDLEPRLMQVRGKVAAERELKNPPPELNPLDAGFIDLPQKTLDQHRRQGDASVLGRVLSLAGKMREEV